MQEVIKSLKSLFDIDSNTLATIIITIIVFFLGYLFNHINNVLIACSERKILRKILRTNIKKLDDEVRNQADAFYKISQELQINNKETFQFVSVTMGSLKVFQSIGYEKMYRAFFGGFENMFRKNDNRVNSLTSFWNLIETIGTIDLILHQDYKDLVNGYEAINEQRNLLTIKIQEIVDANILFFVTRPKIEELMEYHIDLNETLRDFFKLADRDLPHNVQNYHQNLKHLFHKYMEETAKYEKDLKCNQIVPLIKEASFRYAQLKQLLLKNRENYIQLNKSFINYSLKLDGIKQQL